MEHPHTSTPVSNRPFRVPIMVWLLAAGLLIALAAIFIFDVSVSTVGTYALLVLFMGSHFFMHGGHGGHGAHSRPTLNQTDTKNDSQSKDEHTGHSGGCH